MGNTSWWVARRYFGLVKSNILQNRPAKVSWLYFSVFREKGGGLARTLSPTTKVGR